MKSTITVKKCYRSDLVAAAAVQMFLFLISCLAMDGGQLAQWVIYSIAIYWVMALLVVARRPNNPTKGDRIAILFGYFFILVGFVGLTSLKWASMGLTR